MNDIDCPATSSSDVGSPFFWDAFCIATLIGIWPRFIEPRLINTTQVTLELPRLPDPLDGFKILQISDLHITDQEDSSFDRRLLQKIGDFKPDLIALTGDFLCYARLYNRERLASLLQQLHAPYGCYAVLGNHDYASFVSVNPAGDYDVVQTNAKSSISRAFGRLFSTITLTKKVTPAARNVPLHKDLIDLLGRSPVKLLHNDTLVIDVKGAKLNVCGVGEYSLGKLDAETAFRNYDKESPGIVLMHNPDGIKLLAGRPGEVVLSGHTHGGQVNLPWMWKKFVQLEDMRLKKGPVRIDGKWLYVNRGLGSVMPFRWFSPPEILQLTLKGAP